MLGVWEMSFLAFVQLSLAYSTNNSLKIIWIIQVISEIERIHVGAATITSATNHVTKMK